ncbi:MAG: DNA adenine methylase [Planctomycetes bacterium]|nr:DNA adenine methylase [Planctomycetota bacterium]
MEPRYCTPLRYPGGKASLAGFLSDAIDMNDLRGGAYYEPYAGGAGAAFTLLLDGVVSCLFLNDADVRIYSFWRSVLYDAKRFTDRVASIPLTIEEWRKQRAIYEAPRRYSRFDVGFSAFYLNRCNRSGVLGGGPIGGFSQAGNWTMDVRFNREVLAGRILRIAEVRGCVRFAGKDALRFLAEELPRGRGRQRCFVYLDPPYVDNGRRLYRNFYQEADHRSLCTYLRRQKELPWIMSYDDTLLIRSLYSGFRMAELPLRYVLNEKRAAHELIISPSTLAFPSGYYAGKAFQALRKIA